MTPAPPPHADRRIPSSNGPAHIRILDTVVSAIRENIADYAPERGAALVGYGSLIVAAIPDTSGAYTSVSWDISTDLGAVIGQLETAGSARFLGTVHSHPTGVVNPSGQDVASTTQQLQANAHIASLVVAIVTAGGVEQFNQIAVGDRHRMTFHVMSLSRSGQGLMAPVEAKVVPIAGLVAATGFGGDSSFCIPVSRWLGQRDEVERSMPRFVDNQYLTGFSYPMPAARNGWRREIVIPVGYPVAGPVAYAFGPDGAEVPTPFAWDPAENPKHRSSMLGALTRIPFDEAPSGETEHRLDRVTTITGPLDDKHVLVAGAGSVGSAIAERLARSGVRTFTLIDPDLVSPPNLARSAYSTRDLGTAKVTALQAILTGIGTDITVRTYQRSLYDVPVGALLPEVDLVVGATDDMTQQTWLTDLAYHAGVPVVCSAMYAGLRGGEVILSVPAAHTPCVKCSLGGSANAEKAPKDYGQAGRLVAEPGLGAAIDLVSATASLMAIGLLAGRDRPAGAHVLESLRTGRVLGLIATTSQWEVTDSIAEALLGKESHSAHLSSQLLPQSIWLRTQSIEGCNVCSA
ncbi:ThiF family adenylyltransferase [Nocardia salmonicida]|uniref:ThiF family adenylyltransferase n=1 Tax=Nocardia salmonicida TaxID=53431 RepID=UPI0033F17879